MAHTYSPARFVKKKVWKVAPLIYLAKKRSILAIHVKTCPGITLIALLENAISEECESTEYYFNDSTLLINKKLTLSNLLSYS